ncbi:Deubiquitinating protein VCIP135, partial [Dissostichus eleginoides]
NYSFPLNNVVCSYDPQKDVLIPDYKMSSLNTCNWCHGTSVRHIHGDGAVVYLDGDRTNTRSDGGKCGCGFKHFWESKEYDNLPEAFPITLEWGGRVVRETVYWFQYEVEATLNSNVYDVAMKLVTKHFPGEFGSETLVQKVVNTILHHTAKKNPDEYNPVSIDGAHDQRLTDAMDQQPPTKIILTGQKSKTLHKEELTMSRAERSLQQSISDQAFVTQRRRTDKLKQEQKGNRRSSSPSGSPETSSSSSAPEKKIRVTTSDGRQAMLTLLPVTTFSELQRRISTQFNVPPSQQQCIRYGFPPKELLRPRDGEENEPVALQHGDRVTVEILKVLEEEQGPPAVTPSSSHSVLHSEKRSEETSSGRELQESIDLEMSSLCLLATLMGEDVWSYAKKLPHLFQQGGVFFNIVKKDMGLLDGKHCSLPHLTGKTFVFNAAAERLDLCVDAAGHFPVSPEVEEQVKEALLQLQVRSEASGGSRESRESSEASGVLRLGGGGVVRKKETFQSLTAFQGRGHSLESDLRELDLRELDLREVDLREVDLRELDLRELDLREVDLRELGLREVDLRELDLRELDLREVDLRELDLRELDLRELDLRELDLRELDLRELALRELDLRELDLREVDLRELDLRELDLRELDLRELDLREVDLRELDLRELDLREVDLRELDLREVDLREVDLRELDLRELDLRELDLREGQIGSSSPPEHRPITRQHSSGVDLSSSVTREAPDLSQIPELVRMAPGFVRMKEGGRPDPGLMEQQRRQLQDMVSSIQASMERHLREGNTTNTVRSQQPTSAEKPTSADQPTSAEKPSSADQPTSVIQQQTSVKQQPNSAEQQPTSVEKPPDGKPDPKEEQEQMESQEAGPDGAIEPMDHS